MIAAPVMPLHLYVFFPTAILCTVVTAILAFPPLAAVQGMSETFMREVKVVLPQLLHADRIAFQQVKRMIKAQRVFGYKVGPSFVSLGTLQTIFTESISNSLLMICLAREFK